MKRTTLLAALAALALLPGPAQAQEGGRKPTFEVYGFAQVDYIQDFNRVDPAYDAMLRPTKIPTADGQWGSDGQAILSARQSRLGVRASTPAGAHDLKARIEFDFFGRSGGSPDSAGQNGVRLRRAYGEWGQLLGGLTASLFMDDEWWPNVVEYWGPSGMVFYRNVQLRYTPLTGEHAFAVALERPGADIGAYDPVPTLTGDNKLPDFTAQYRLTQGWGYVQLSGIVRRLGWESGVTSAKSTVGWGVNASSTITLIPGRLNLLAAVVTGAGISNYMNDATPDAAADGTPPKGKAVPLTGISAYVDVTWSPTFTSSAGYSTVMLSTTDGQGDGEFEQGQYASINLLATPAQGFLVGPELQWGQRTDKGGATGTDTRVQITLKYAFSSNDFLKSR